MTPLVDALWIAGYHAELPDKTPLTPRETVARIPESEARNSDHWQIVDKTKPQPTPARGEKE